MNFLENGNLVHQLESCWEWETGFFGLLRRGLWDENSLMHVIHVLESIRLTEPHLFSKRIVSLLWYMPLFMVWQEEQLQENGIDPARYQAITNQIQELIESILGVP